MGNFKLVWHSFKKNMVRNIVFCAISLGGIISIVVDVVEDYMPKELNIGITIVTAFITFVTILLPIIDYYSEKLYSKGECAAVKTVLKHCGIVDNNEVLCSEKCTPATLTYDLLDIVARCIRKCTTRCIDGDNKIPTGYYVYTLSIAHLENKLKIMTDYMFVLLNEIIGEIRGAGASNCKQCFFLIVPYGRNVLLGEALANYMNIPVLVSQIGKYEKDTGKRRDDPYEYLYENYVGTDSLEKYIKDQQLLSLSDNNITDIVFNGIIVDCNTTKGSQMHTIASNFNSNIYTNNDKIFSKLKIDTCRCNLSFSKISYCATLFLAAADKARGICNDGFKNNGLHLRYFFELTEDAKEKIFLNKDKIEAFDLHKGINDDVINICAQACNFNNTDKKDIEECIMKIN